MLLFFAGVGATLIIGAAAIAVYRLVIKRIVDLFSKMQSQIDAQAQQIAAQASRIALLEEAHVKKMPHDTYASLMEGLAGLMSLRFETDLDITKDEQDLRKKRAMQRKFDEVYQNFLNARNGRKAS